MCILGCGKQVNMAAKISQLLFNDVSDYILKKKEEIRFSGIRIGNYRITAWIHQDRQSSRFNYNSAFKYN